MSSDGNTPSSKDEEDDYFDPELAPDFSPSAWHGRNMGQLLQTAPRGMPVQNSEDLERILALPRRPVVTKDSATAQALVELQMAKFSRGERQCRCAEIDNNIRIGRRRCIKKLKWEQAWALHEMSAYGGLVASITVGAGKSLLDILAALALREVKLALLLIPSALRGQIKREYELVAEHFWVPSFVVHFPGNKSWCSEVQRRPDGSTAPTVHVVPYQYISDQRRSAWIEGLKPDAIIADESDSLADYESTRTMRVMRYFEQHHARTRFCGWTGSLTDSSVSEFSHIYMWSLRHKSPLPVNREVVDQWSRCLDAIPNPCPAGALVKFLEPGEGIHQVRSAIHRRLAETPGIMMIGGKNVIITDAGDEVRNDIREKPAPTIPDRVLKALAMARDNFRPDSLVSEDPDEILFDPLEQARVVRQVATGVFYRWNWEGISRELAGRWLLARKAWHAELRWKMLQGEVNLDSPKLCEDAARRYYGELPMVEGLPVWRAENWPAWRDVRPLVNKGRDPKTEAKWIDKFLAEDAAQWASTHKGLVWYGMKEFAEEVGRLTGLPVFGDSSEKALENELQREKAGDRSILLSIKSHGRGRNGLQFVYDHQLVLNTLASARSFQQLYGRLYRDRQQSNGIDTEIYLHTQELRKTLEQALRRGEYVKDMTTEDQMLIDGWRGFTTALADTYRGVW